MKNTCMPVGERPRCKFLYCLAGQGLAGMGICFLGGEWDSPDCSKYEDEKEWMDEGYLRWVSGEVYTYEGEV